MAYTVTFSSQPTKYVYLDSSPIEYYIKVAYGGGDDVPALIECTLTIVQAGVTYTETVQKTAAVYGSLAAYFYFDFSEIIKKYTYPVLSFADIADTDARHLNIMDCYFQPSFQLFVEDGTTGLTESEGSPFTPSIATVGAIRGRFQTDNATRDINDYLFLGNSGVTSKSILSTRPNGGKIGALEWEVGALPVMGDFFASSEPLNAMKVTCYYTGLTTNNNVNLTFPNNTTIKDDLYYIVPIGTANVGGVFPFGTPNSYEVTFGYLSGGGTFTKKYAPIRREIVNCVPDAKVIFFNSLGGIDFFNFYFERVQEFEANRNAYSKQQPSFFYTNINVSRTGGEVLTANSLQKITLQTKCTAEEYAWLAKELLLSGKAYIMLENFGIDSTLIPVNLLSSNIEAYNSETAEYFTTFEFQYSNPILSL